MLLRRGVDPRFAAVEPRLCLSNEKATKRMRVCSEGKSNTPSKFAAPLFGTQIVHPSKPSIPVSMPFLAAHLSTLDMPLKRASHSADLIDLSNEHSRKRAKFEVATVQAIDDKEEVQSFSVDYAALDSEDEESSLNYSFDSKDDESVLDNSFHSEDDESLLGLQYACEEDDTVEAKSVDVPESHDVEATEPSKINLSPSPASMETITKDDIRPDSSAEVSPALRDHLAIVKQQPWKTNPRFVPFLKRTLATVRWQKKQRRSMRCSGVDYSEVAESHDDVSYEVATTQIVAESDTDAVDNILPTSAVKVAHDFDEEEEDSFIRPTVEADAVVDGDDSNPAVAFTESAECIAESESASEPRAKVTSKKRDHLVSTLDGSYWAVAAPLRRSSRSRKQTVFFTPC